MIRPVEEICPLCCSTYKTYRSTRSETALLSAQKRLHQCSAVEILLASFPFKELSEGYYRELLELLEVLIHITTMHSLRGSPWNILYPFLRKICTVQYSAWCTNLTTVIRHLSSRISQGHSPIATWNICVFSFPLFTVRVVECKEILNANWDEPLKDNNIDWAMICYLNFLRFVDTHRCWQM